MKLIFEYTKRRTFYSANIFIATQGYLMSLTHDVVLSDTQFEGLKAAYPNIEFVEKEDE